MKNKTKLYFATIIALSVILTTAGTSFASSNINAFPIPGALAPCQDDPSTGLATSCKVATSLRLANDPVLVALVSTSLKLANEKIPTVLSRSQSAEAARYQALADRQMVIQARVNQAYTGRMNGDAERMKPSSHPARIYWLPSSVETGSYNKGK